MKTEKDDILILKFLRNQLTIEEKELFAQKLKSKSFQNEVQLQMALYKALDEDDKKEFETIAKQTLLNLSNKTKKRKLIIAYSSIASLAALLLIVFVIIKPFGGDKMANYIAMAEPPAELVIEKVRSIRTTIQDSASIFETCEKIMIAAVPDRALETKYFFDGCTLYTYFIPGDPVKILVDLDNDSQKEYFLCKDKTLYKLSKTKPIKNKKLYELIPVVDSAKGNYCK